MDMVRQVIDQSVVVKLKTIPLLNNTIGRRIEDISGAINLLALGCDIMTMETVGPKARPVESHCFNQFNEQTLAAILQIYKIRCCDPN